ncbi:hypothetical protein ACH4NO_18295 [Streptomyces olivaceus]|uniref:hypothetical protein n=1 Tax=Streptomyces olivaceus TaxID=47716 RepID=UPI0037B35131
MTPADEMLAAADKLRSTCTAASPGPWKIAKVRPYTDPLLMSRYDETPDDKEVLIAGSIDVDPSDQAVVQMLHPGVGVALAEWLETEAAQPLTAQHGPRCTADCTTTAALAVARQINGAP